MGNIRNIILSFAFFFGVMQLAAQGVAVTPPYAYGFEDDGSSERSLWTLLNTGQDGSACPDQWYIGAAAAKDGVNSLYISSDGGATVSYGRNENIVVAYREMELPTGRYNVTFDWFNLADGKIGDRESGLFVCIIPSANAIFAPYSESGPSDLPIWMVQAQTCTLADGSSARCLKGSRQWQSAQFQLPATAGQPFYLLFAWVNTQTLPQPFPIGAAVDNIEITNATCPIPYGLSVEGDCSLTTVRWEGTAGNYELEYRPYGVVDGWRRVSVRNAKEYQLSDLAEGYYDFRVRGVCGGGMYSNWHSLSGQLVFCPGNHCINYIDLDAPGVQCYEANVSQDFSPCAPIDYGPESADSRHTVHTTMDEYDPRTNYALRTIPPEEFGSVRLGNWKADELDRIEYTYTVDTNEAAMMLLKYAIVFEQPNHEIENQPYFNLVILDAFGNELSPLCGKAEFYAQPGVNGWQTIPGVPGESEDIVWKDWTTLGLNMRPYHGQTVRIQITTRDCNYRNGHFGYGYFTLGCAKGTIEGLSCGASEFMELKAPDGFDYEWSVSTDPGTVISTDQIYKASASDTREYIVKCMYRENHDCQFELRTKVSPRTAKADFTYEFVPEDCQNIVKITNTSHVVSRDEEGNVVDLYDDRISDIIWDFGDGTPVYETSPRCTVPQEGGTISLYLHAALSGEDAGCSDDTTFTITVPSILSDIMVKDTTVCFGEGVQWGTKLYNASGTYYDTCVNIAGCDSVNQLNLTVLPRIDETERCDTVCFGDVFTAIPGYTFDRDSTYELTLTTPHGCDSVVIVHLHVMPEVTFSVDHTDEEGEPNSGSITITDAPEGYSWSLDGVPSAPLTGLSGGTYKLVVYNSFGCPGDTVTVEIESDCLDVTFDLPDSITACGGDSVILLLCKYNKGTLTTYSIAYDDRALAAGFADVSEAAFDGQHIDIVLPDSCRPDSYRAQLTLHDIICDDIVLDLPFAVYYDASVVRQKWNNVLAVTNEGYNGGYTFSSFRWFCNGSPVSGEAASYLYLGEGSAFDTTDVYHVELTRADDGVTMPTCPVVPTLHTDVTPYPTVTVAAPMQGVKIRNVSAPVSVALYSVTGQTLWTGTLSSGADMVRMPDTAGVYLLVIGDGDECRTYKLMVR